MKFFDCIITAYKGILANKIRVMLTILGIIIGISSVIIIVSIGKGGQEAISYELQKLGVNGINIKPRPGFSNSRDGLTFEDAQRIKEYIPNVEKVTPVFNGFGVIRRNTKTREAFIWGVDEEFKDLFSLNLLYGRLLNKSDIQAGRDVIIIDNVLARNLFRYENVVGKDLFLNCCDGSFRLKIIGVVRNANEVFEDVFGELIPAFVYMPVSSVQRIYNVRWLDQISVKVKEDADADEIGLNIIKYLERKNNNSDIYFVENMMKQKEQVDNVAGILTFIVSAIAAISLIVGGIGIMNIMLVSVTERTKEIGIRKAMGAMKKAILMQFVIESIIMSTIGGIIGVCGGISVSWTISKLSGLPMKIPISSLVITVLFSSLVGFVFGVYPAKKAADLDPIEALRN